MLTKNRDTSRDSGLRAAEGHTHERCHAKRCVAWASEGDPGVHAPNRLEDCRTAAHSSRTIIVVQTLSLAKYHITAWGRPARRGGTPPPAPGTPRAPRRCRKPARPRPRHLPGFPVAVAPEGLAAAARPARSPAGRAGATPRALSHRGGPHGQVKTTARDVSSHLC